MVNLRIVLPLAVAVLAVAPSLSAEAEGMKLRAFSSDPSPSFAPPAGTVKAPAFTLSDPITGDLVHSKKFAGKVLIVDFWATWCPPCRAEIPGFINLQNKYQAKGLEVIGISVDKEGPEVVRKFAEENGINYTLCMVNPEVRAGFGGFKSIPTTFVVGRRGFIYKKYTGSQPEATFEKDVQDLL